MQQQCAAAELAYMFVHPWYRVVVCRGIRFLWLVGGALYRTEYCTSTVLVNLLVLA